MSNESVSGVETLSYLNQQGPDKPIVVRSPRDPTQDDKQFKIGTLWINEVNNHVYQLTSVSGGLANWEPLSQSAGGNAPITEFVVALDGRGDFTSIQEALTAANLEGGGVVAVRPGIYTENLTLYDNTEVVKFGSSLTESTVIIGQHTPPLSGFFAFKDIYLENNSHLIFSIGAGSSKLIFEGCTFEATAIAYIVNLINWTGDIDILSCNSVGTVSQGTILNTNGSSAISIINSFLGLQTIGSVLPSAVNGSLLMLNSHILNNFEFTGSSTIDIRSSSIKPLFSPAVKFFDSSSGIISNSALFSRSSNPPVVQESTGDIQINDCNIDTNNDPAIDGTGAGTVNLVGVSFTDNSNVNSALTVVSGRVQGANFTTQYVVDPNGISGEYKTIQDALDAANAAGGGSIYLHQGAYVEDLTLYPNIEILKAGDSLNGDALIQGQHTPPSVGVFTFKNVYLRGNPDVLNSTAAGDTILIIDGCTIQIATGYLVNVPNWIGDIFIRGSRNILSTSDGIVNNQSGSSAVQIIDSDVGIQNPGVPTFCEINGSLFAKDAILNTGVNAQGNSFVTGYHSFFINNSSPALTFNNTANGRFFHCYVETQTAAAIDQKSTSDVIFVQTIINTPNFPAIDADAATGTFTYDKLSFVSARAFSANLAISTFVSRNGTYVADDAGDGIDIREGTNCRQGLATLVAGTVTVNTTATQSNSRIQLTTQVPGGTVGSPYVSARVVSTSFTITSTNGADTSNVAWTIFDPAQ